MTARLSVFINALRDAGLPITVAETLDAMRAAAAAGIERAVLRESLAAALVKDEADRPLFEDVFNRFFAAPPRTRRRTEHMQPAREGEGHGAGTFNTAPSQHPVQRRDEPRPAADEPRRAERPRPDAHLDRGRKLARAREVSSRPFREMTAHDIEESAALVAALATRFRAHLSRRQRADQRGRLDVRRTMRRAISSGGVPLDLAFRRRRPGRPDLVALCDYSHSVIAASNFLLGLLAPAHAFFRHVQLFAYVDRPVAVTVESRGLVPHALLDHYARSDFGRVLSEFHERYATHLTRNTILLILGDARNNRRPPRHDVLARIHAGAIKRIVWLNPEPPARWNTGDSVMRLYAPYCDVLLSASNLRELFHAVETAFVGQQRRTRAAAIPHCNRTAMH
jgi:uncharacterized protein